MPLIASRTEFLDRFSVLIRDYLTDCARTSSVIRSPELSTGVVSLFTFCI